MEEFNKALPNKNYVEAANMLKQVRALGSCRYEAWTENEHILFSKFCCESCIYGKWDQQTSQSAINQLLSVMQIIHLVLLSGGSLL